METEIANRYANNIEKLINATLSNQVEWKKQNPSTYFYEYRTEDNTVLTTSVQKIVTPKIGLTFQIINSGTKEILVLINVGETSSYKTLSSMFSGIYDPIIPVESSLGVMINQLYNSVDYYVASKGLKAFDDVIRGLYRE